MAIHEMVVKDINEDGEAAYKDGDHAIVTVRLDYIPRQHDVLKFEDKYYEIVRVIKNLDDWNSPLTIVVRKYVMIPKMIYSGISE